MAGKSKSAKYYASNPEAKKKKDALSKEINSRPYQKDKRAELGRIRRKAEAEGKDIKGKDYNHGTKKFTSVKANRGATKGTVGDRNARGGGKRK